MKALLPLLISGVFAISVANAATPAQQKLYFLSSIDESTLKGPFYLHWGYFQHYISGLESIFQDHFQNLPYQLVVEAHANRADLFEALHDPQAVGVFWVSHGDPFNWQAGNGLLKLAPQLLDSSGADVAEVFKSIPSNIKWVSVVSCDSGEILNASDTDQTKIATFKQFVDPHTALADTLTASDAVLNNPSSTPTAVVQQAGRSIQITRSYSIDSLPSDYVFPSVTVQYKGVDVAAFQAVTADEIKNAGKLQDSQTIWLPMPKGDIHADDLMITIDSGLSALSVSSDFTLGNFTIQGSWNKATWKVFSDLQNGAPYGVTKNIFLYSGPNRANTPTQLPQ